MVIYMKKRTMQEFINDGMLKISFNGFYDYTQFDEALKIYTKEMGAVCTNSSVGFFDSASSVTILEGIELQWNFDNWICIELSYSNPDDTIVKDKIRQWANQIFTKLIKKYGEYDET